MAAQELYLRRRARLERAGEGTRLHHVATQILNIKNRCVSLEGAIIGDGLDVKRDRIRPFNRRHWPPP